MNSKKLKHQGPFQSDVEAKVTSPHEVSQVPSDSAPLNMSDSDTDDADIASTEVKHTSTASVDPRDRDRVARIRCERIRRGQLAVRFQELHDVCLKINPDLKAWRPSRDSILRNATEMLQQVHKSRTQKETQRGNPLAKKELTADAPSRSRTSSLSLTGQAQSSISSQDPLHPSSNSRNRKEQLDASVSLAPAYQPLSETPHTSPSSHSKPQRPSQDTLATALRFLQALPVEQLRLVASAFSQPAAGRTLPPPLVLPSASVATVAHPPTPNVNPTLPLPFSTSTWLANPYMQQQPVFGSFAGQAQPAPMYQMLPRVHPEFFHYPTLPMTYHGEPSQGSPTSAQLQQGPLAPRAQHATPTFGSPFATESSSQGSPSLSSVSSLRCSSPRSFTQGSPVVRTVSISSNTTDQEVRRGQRRKRDDDASALGRDCLRQRVMIRQHNKSRLEEPRETSK